MPPKCRPNVAAARTQTASMLKEAEKAINAMAKERIQRYLDERGLEGPRKKKTLTLVPPNQRSAESCRVSLQSARMAFATAERLPDELAQRDGFIRATFQAGQALACAQVAKIGVKLGTMPAPKKPKKPKKPKTEPKDEA